MMKGMDAASALTHAVPGRGAGRPAPTALAGAAAADSFGAMLRGARGASEGVPEGTTEGATEGQRGPTPDAGRAAADAATQEASTGTDASPRADASPGTVVRRSGEDTDAGGPAAQEAPASDGLASSVIPGAPAAAQTPVPLPVPVPMVATGLPQAATPAATAAASPPSNAPALPGSPSSVAPAPAVPTPAPAPPAPSAPTTTATTATSAPAGVSAGPPAAMVPAAVALAAGPLPGDAGTGLDRPPSSSGAAPVQMPGAEALAAAGNAAGATALAAQPASSPAAAQQSAPPAPAQAGPALQPQVAKPLFTLAGAPHGQHIMTLQVSPEDLGPLTVRAHIDAAGVRIELFAAGDAGREAIRGILPELRKELTEAGFDASLDVSGHNNPGGAPRDGRGGDPTGQGATGRDPGSGPGDRYSRDGHPTGRRWNALADGAALRTRALNGPQTTLDILV